LTTYFEGEIIGNKHTFKTAHPEWGSSEKVDMQHWARFPAWRPLAQQAQSPCFTFKNYAQHDHLFMRWKEYFLVPDHKVKTITGASFEGFYYICFNQSAGSVTGIYFTPRARSKLPSACPRRPFTDSVPDTSSSNLSMSRIGAAWERWSFDRRL